VTPNDSVRLVKGVEAGLPILAADSNVPLVTPPGNLHSEILGL
jgi:hypothetical protein